MKVNIEDLLPVIIIIIIAISFFRDEDRCYNSGGELVYVSENWYDLRYECEKID